MKTKLYDLSRVNAKLLEAIAPWHHLFETAPDELLSIGNDAKTIKGETLNVKTAVMYFAPADLSGFNVCAMAEIAKCKDACLFSAGHGVTPQVMASRLRRTLYWLQHREAFIVQLCKEIARFERYCAAKGFKCVVRLNGTSDIRWELHGIMERFPNVQFYDYTKLPNRDAAKIPTNYDLTFSYSGAPEFAPHVAKAKRAGMRIAVVFRTKELVARMIDEGARFIGLSLVNGDDTDVRHRDPKGVAVALYAKGKARRDRGPFVQD